MNKRTRWAAGIAAAAGGIATAVAPPASAELQVIPTVGVTENWTDNYFLVRSNEQQEDQLVTLANAELLVLQQNERLRTRFRYHLESVLDGPESGELFHDGRLDVGAEVLRDWFFVDVAGAYGQYASEPQDRRNPANLFPVGDSVTDVGTGSATGALRHDFDRVHVEAGYTAGGVRYVRAPASVLEQLQDSRYRLVNAGLSSVSNDETRLTWSGDYQQHSVEYDGGLEVAHDLARLDLALRVVPALSLLARGGLESDPREIDAEGGLDESTWHAGFSYHHRRGELRLMAGQGAFGDSYDGSLTAAGRIVNIDIGYREETTTQTEQFLPRLATDPAGNLITVTGNAVLSGIDDPFGRLNADIFHNKSLRGRVALTGRLTDIELAFRAERRSYLLSGAKDKVRGVNLTISRSLGPRSRAELDARYDTVSVQGGDRFIDQLYSMTFYRQIGQRIQLTASASRAKLSSTEPFAANWIAIGLQMSFGRAAGSTPGPRTMSLPSQTSGTR